MKRLLSIALIQFVLSIPAVPAAAEAMFSLDMGAGIPLVADEAWSPYLGLSAGFDLYKPVSEISSFFLRGDGELRVFPAGNSLSSDLSIKGDYSFMKNIFVMRSGLEFLFEWQADSLYPYIDLKPELLFSLNFQALSLSTVHSLDIRVYPSADFTYNGEMSASFLIGRQLLVQPMVAYQQAIGPAADSDTYLEGSVKHSWYAGAIFIMDGNAGFRRIFSPTVRNEITLFEAVTLSLGKTGVGKSAQLVFSIPTILTFYDGDPTLYYSVAPLASLDISLFKYGFVTIDAGPVFQTDQSNTSAYSGIKADLSFSFVF